MTRRGHGRPTASLFVQVLMLVGLSLIIAQAISVLKDALEKRKEISSMNREQDRKTDEILDALDDNGNGNGNGDSVRSPVDRDR